LVRDKDRSDRAGHGKQAIIGDMERLVRDQMEVQIGKINPVFAGFFEGQTGGDQQAEQMQVG